ncbi:hypothetical protein L1987_43763 [Smallanthus sonchifolius]|uniref:Uncharacterized protein n=1 Tax=Smallanthus sonchifolius TaxID=185202 RepID=A0ACB9GNI0_9ASTR|nr:hypothetical protein L1987_43763 [Smallanthus sonchifolius]
MGLGFPLLDPWPTKGEEDCLRVSQSMGLWMNILYQVHHLLQVLVGCRDGVDGEEELQEVKNHDGWDD